MPVSNAARKWQVYRNRHLIKARQLTRPLIFVDPLGGEHRGKKGAYLVESDNGTRRIWPRRLFEDSHVPLEPAVSDLLLAAAPEGLEDALQGASPPPRIGPKRTADAHCGKTVPQPRTPAVNCLRYNI